MTQARWSSKYGARQNQYWMRAISFAGLHRILNAIAAFPNGLKASEINKLVRDNNLLLTRRTSTPALTTLYHYRNTLLRLRALKRDGRMLRINDADPDVFQLLCQPAPAKEDQLLSDSVRDRFAALVLKNEQCRSLFFDLFMPSDVSSDTVASFRRNGFPVKWTRERSPKNKEVVFQNNTTGRTARCTSPVSVAAILYGVRYWARDELGLIDEYCRQADGDVIMFPVSRPELSAAGSDRRILRTVHFLLSLRDSKEWTLFSISDLITRCCEARRQPITVLFGAIDWLCQEWPHHTVLIPTSRALATLTAPSTQRETLELRRYYRASNGPYISHLRVHKDIALEPMELTDHHVRYPSKTQASF